MEANSVSEWVMDDMYASKGPSKKWPRGEVKLQW